MRFGYENSHENYGKYNILYHAEANVVLHLTPKVANTAIKKAIFRGMGKDLDYDYDLGFEFINPHQAAMVTIEGAKSVAFVRDPVKRVISCWRDKVIGQGANPKDFSFIFKPDQPFHEFIEEIILLSPAEMNQHFRPQTFNFKTNGGNFVKPHHIFKFEDFIKDFSPVAYKLRNLGLGCEDTLEHMNPSKPIPATYNERTHVLLNKIYHEDMRLLSYESATIKG